MLRQKWVKEYLVFNRKDRIGLIAFIVVVAGGILLPKLFAGNQSALNLKEDPLLVKAMDTLRQRAESRKLKSRESANYSDSRSDYQFESSQTVPFTNGELFQFDPNTIKAGDWQRLGLNERTSKTIEKYVSKGGKFYKPEDLMKIWGMPEGFYERVKDYVVISSVQRNYPQKNENGPFEIERKPSLININAADTSAFISLPGIGGKLSARIVAFRDKLGGFYSVEQIGETYGLPDSTFQKIKGRMQVDGGIRKLNINSATKDELKVHPYIRWNLANAIVEYRNQHGAFKNLEDLKNIALVDEVIYNKIRHYLDL